MMMMTMKIIMLDLFAHFVPTVSIVTAAISAHVKREMPQNTATTAMIVENATSVLFVIPSASQVVSSTRCLDPSIRLSQTSLTMTTTTTTNKPTCRHHVAKRETSNWALRLKNFRIYIVAICLLSLSYYSLFLLMILHATVWLKYNNKHCNNFEINLNYVTLFSF